MVDRVVSHYTGSGDLASQIAESLRSAGKDISRLTTADLAAVDEFHIRDRKATLELAQSLNLSATTLVLDIGSGLGGPARTLAETYGCRVTGIDLTQAFCDAAATLSGWVGLSDRVTFQQGDATSLPFADAHFDAAMTIHVAMNIASKDQMYAEARRVLKRGSRFGVYDILQGEGGEMLFPVLGPVSHPSVIWPHLMPCSRLDGCRVQDCGRARLRGGKPALVRGNRGTDGTRAGAIREIPGLPRQGLPPDGPQPGQQPAGPPHPHGELYLSGLNLRLCSLRKGLSTPGSCSRSYPGASARPY